MQPVERTDSLRTECGTTARIADQFLRAAVLGGGERRGVFAITGRRVRPALVRLGAGKSRRADVLPLPVLTGPAIVEYLRQARRPSTSRAVFVRDRAPLDAPITTEIVRYAVRMAFARCGLGARYTGTHVLRRTTAAQMRCAGASLKQSADVLRHRSLDTTTIYTKIDRPQLATVAAPWPGGVS